MALHVVNEARRCLNCKVPQCRKGCPINTPIPDMIQLFLQNQLEAAGEMLFLNNPLSIVCSLVCDHEKQCEGHCVLGRKGMPVHISSIENYISDAYLDRLSPVLPASSGKRAAIIGSGPAGITIAVLLAQKGHDVTIFESREIHIRPNTSIGGALTVDDLQRDGYQAIFIGTGVWRPKKLGIPGESLGHVHFAIDYLVDPDVYDLGEHLAVIGAGNSAMDVARTALRKGTKKVSVLCRGPKAAASQREVDYAVADGVEFLYGARTESIDRDGVWFKQAEFDQDGNICRLSEPMLFHADGVIIAVSQGPKNKIVSTTSGLQTTEHGLLFTDVHGNTTRPGIFASGDVVLGARTVVEAVKYSKEVAQVMDEYLSSIQD